MEYLLRGILTGLVFGIPIGAIGALMVQRTWTMGVKAGLLTGLGSSAADCLYACVGAFGLTIVSELLMKYRMAITAAGGMLILAMGLRALISPDESVPNKQDGIRGARLFFSSFAIGITNPAAVLTFLFAFSYFGISQINGFTDGCMLVMGVLIGTYFWWGALSLLTQLIKKRAAKFRLCTMNRIFGGVLCLIGATVLLRLVIL